MPTCLGEPETALPAAPSHPSPSGFPDPAVSRRRSGGWLGLIRRHPWLAAVVVLLVLAGSLILAQWPVSYHGRSVSRWLELSASEDYPQRNAAEAAFQALGARAVPDLVAALRARDTFLSRARAWFSQRVLGRDVNRLSSLERRALAAKALASLGPVATSAAPQLVENLADDEGIGHHFTEALRRIGKPAAPAIVRGLHSASLEVRIAAARLLGWSPFDTADELLVSALVAATADGESRVRAAALGALGRRHDPRHVTRMVNGLTDPDAAVRRVAASALGELGPKAETAAPALRRALADPDVGVRTAAAGALWRVTGEVDEALAVLQRELASTNNTVGNFQAAYVVAEIGRAAETVIPVLLQRLAAETFHRPSRTPSPTAFALGKIGPAAVPGLIALLDHSRTEVRISAAMALKWQSTNAAPAIGRLIELVDHPDGELRITAVDALGAIGAAARPALPTLRQLSEEATDYLRAAAVNAVQSIEAAGSAEALPANPP